MTRSLISFGIAAVAAIAISSAASASDLPLPLKSAYTPYYSTTPAYDWTGFYLGLQGGMVNSRSDTNISAIGFGTVATTTMHGTGGIGGVFAGYRWQSGSLIYGVEGDFNIGGPRGSTDVLGASGGYSSKWDTTVRGTLGYAISPQFLVYATGGLDVARFSNTVNLVGVSESWSSTKAGWTLGIGADYRINQNWFAGLQYRHSEWGTTSHNLSSLPGIGVSYKPSADTVLARVGFNF